MKTNYWDNKAKDYDSHLKKSKNAYDQIIELTKNEVHTSQVLLDIGTGTGEIPIKLAEYVDKIEATDYSAEMIHIANTKKSNLNKNNITFHVQDCYNLSFQNEMFDIILAANILHVLDEPGKFLDCTKKFLKNNGKLILPTFLHNENIKTRIISKILQYKGHPIITKFDSGSIIDFIEKFEYRADKQVLLPGIMPMLYIVATRK